MLAFSRNDEESSEEIEAIKPFTGDYEFDNYSFLRNYINHLLPPPQKVLKFVDLPDDQFKTTLLRVAAAIIDSGSTELGVDILTNVNGYELEKHKQIAFLCSANTQKLLREHLTTTKMNTTPSETEFLVWLSCVISRLIFKWFDTKTIYRIAMYSESILSPVKLLANINNREECDNWKLVSLNGGLLKSGFYGFDFNTATNKAKILLQRLHHFGANSEFYNEFKFYDFLPPASTFDLVSQFMFKTDKESVDISAVLISIYLPLINIERSIKALK